MDSERIILDPFEPDMIQPSSVDVRLDRFFRLFDNHKYAHIDPQLEQPELTRLVEVDPEEPLILHPGEFCPRLHLRDGDARPTTSPPGWRASPRWGGWAC